MFVVRLPQLEYYFSSFFLILLRLSTFEPLNALYSKFEELKISEMSSARLKLGVPSWGDPPQTSPPKFQTFKPLEVNESNCWKWVDIINKLN